MSILSYLQRGFNSIASLRFFSFTSSHESLIATQISSSPDHNILDNCKATDNKQQIPSEFTYIFDSMADEKDVIYNPNVLQTTESRLRSIFSNCPKEIENLFTMMVLHKTVNDMSVWSYDSQNEREHRSKLFVGIATEVCSKIRALGYWSNFIDPTSGIPFEGPYSNETFTDCDEDFAGLSDNLQLEDIGCCRALKHINWGFNVFPGLIVCSAPQDVVMNAYNSSLLSSSLN